jgi:hypothetical protein
MLDTTYNFGGLDTGFCYVAQAVLKLSILLPQHLECWDFRCVPLCRSFIFNLIFVMLGIKLRASQMLGKHCTTGSYLQHCNPFKSGNSLFLSPFIIGN